MSNIYIQEPPTTGKVLISLKILITLTFLCILLRRMKSIN